MSGGSEAMRIALVHYHEIGLKGRNRGSFERRLEGNLRWTLRDIPSAEVLRIASRVLVRVHADDEIDSVAAALGRTPGVAYVITGIETEAEPGAIGRTALTVAREELSVHPGVRTFAIDARRSATCYPERSSEINRRVGELVRLETGLTVDLDDPELAIRVLVIQNRAYVCARRTPGVGGLPVGTSGPIVTLLSSGIDSPVAAWRIMRRGATIIGVHFSGRPQTTGTSEEYASRICDVLAAGGGMGRLYIVAFGDVQREIALATPDDLRVLLYRRMMIRVAERIAERENARALVTGESLGQVASQTLENLVAVDAGATMAVLRPLVGSDKQEIIAEARRIGTFELSTTATDDCCTLFMPRRPQTHVRPGELEQAERALDIPALVERSLASLRTVDFPSVSYRSPGGPR